MRRRRGGRHHRRKPPAHAATGFREFAATDRPDFDVSSTPRRALSRKSARSRLQTRASGTLFLRGPHWLDGPARASYIESVRASDHPSQQRQSSTKRDGHDAVDRAAGSRGFAAKRASSDASDSPADGERNARRRGSLQLRFRSKQYHSYRPPIHGGAPPADGPRPTRAGTPHSSTSPPERKAPPQNSPRCRTGKWGPASRTP